jgi:hypothetical protein
MNVAMAIALKIVTVYSQVFVRRRYLEIFCIGHLGKQGESFLMVTIVP